VVLNRLGNGAEDHAGLGQFLAEGRHHGDAVEDGIDRNLRRALDAGKHFLLFQRDTELLIGPEQFRIDLFKAFRPFGAFRRGVVVEILEVDLRIVDPGPGRLGHRAPALVGLKPPFEQPFRLALLGRNETNDVFVQPFGGHDRFNLGREAVLILIDVDFFDAFNGFFDSRHRFIPNLVSILFPISFRSRAAGTANSR
jgi:hypothetical protein